MRHSILLPLFLLCATRAALAVTCGGFSVVPSDHVLVKYSAPLATGTTQSRLGIAVSGSDVAVTRSLSGGSATDQTCVEALADLGYLGAGRFHLTWTDNVNFTSQRSSFTFFVGAPATGTVDTTSVLPPALPQSVRLEVNACSQRAAVAYLSGNDIFISQYGTGSPCKLYVLDFGALPAAVYNVTTTHLDSTFAIPATSSFRFVVQEPAPTSACNGTLTVTRTERGTARLHYEDPYPGYSPIFGPPTVTEISRYVDGTYPSTNWPLITVVQPVADTADNSKLPLGSLPTICHAEELDIGTPEAGYNEIRWYDQVSVNGANAGFRSAPETVAFWWIDGTMQCSTVPRPITPSPAYEGDPIDLTLTLLAGYPAVVKSTVSGKTVTLDVVPVAWEGPLPPYPPEWCQPYRTRLSPLPAGEYQLVWRLDTFPLRVLTSKLTVAKAPRQRAARH